MTWRTELGERVLNPAEAAIFRAAVGSMRDELWEEHRGDYRHLDATAKPVTLEEATKIREPCKVCRPSP